LKWRYGEKSYSKGKQQLADYMDKLDCSEGWLIVFDRRKTVPWEKKIFWQTQRLLKKRFMLLGVKSLVNAFIPRKKPGTTGIVYKKGFTRKEFNQ